MTAPRFRCLGFHPATGKDAYAVAVPGGILDALADVRVRQAAAALHAVVGAVLEAGKATDAELAAFVPSLHAVLGDCLEATALE
ncbi:hypothetical protein MTQ10_17595 [Streptomyces sp. XM83C]|jgi:hypothetical protein|uniref:Uncharacterized protein n=1 Tax=Streptomyces thermocoprophilus TaxID=78356 RepID=A0ABV5VJX3_9ACTN|nr:hypothetical protein [Streptomyces sp. XM83C]MCK1821379.1 hypothetical protein [Streptomyces sp. XM83C]